ncbi:37S ribosomal protein S10, partial [Lachnellula suecica]
TPAPIYGQFSEQKDLDFRLPRSVQAVYLRPLKRAASYGVPSCDLQLRSYNVRNLEFFADFALRAAYYLNLPAFGPVPLPRIVERWTVPKGTFIHKKSQENFERRTVRRLIQIKDGHPETVEVWLAFLRKHAYYGIGMKANVFEFTKLGVGKEMDSSVEQMKDELDKTLGQIGVQKDKKGGPTGEKIMELVNRENFRAATHGNAPMVRRPV